MVEDIQAAVTDLRVVVEDDRLLVMPSGSSGLEAETRPVMLTLAATRARKLGPLYGSLEASIVVTALRMTNDYGWRNGRLLAESLAPDDLHYLDRVMRDADALDEKVGYGWARYLRNAVQYRSDRLTSRASQFLKFAADLADPPEHELKDRSDWPRFVRTQLAELGWPASLERAARRRAEHVLALADAAGIEGVDLAEKADALGLFSFKAHAADIEQVAPWLLVPGLLDESVANRVRAAVRRHAIEVEIRSAFTSDDRIPSAATSDEDELEEDISFTCEATPTAWGVPRFMPDVSEYSDIGDDDWTPNPDQEEDVEENE